jgi:spoIIIJ-associated protein
MTSMNGMSPPPAPTSDALEFVGDTIEDALASALRALGLTAEEAEVDVLDRGARGFLGLGGRPARVRVASRARLEPTVHRLADDLLRLMRIPAEVAVTRTGRGVTVEIRGGEADGLLIGRKGETLAAFQHLLVRMAARRVNGDAGVIRVDVAGYRGRREDHLREQARELADRVRRTGRRTMTEPLSPAERRVVHQALADEGGVESHAAGAGLHKRVVLLPARNAGQTETAT